MLWRVSGFAVIFWRRLYVSPFFLTGCFMTGFAVTVLLTVVLTVDLVPWRGWVAIAMVLQLS
jgi:hypothetical protein